MLIRALKQNMPQNIIWLEKKYQKVHFWIFWISSHFFIFKPRLSYSSGFHDSDNKYYSVYISTSYIYTLK